MVTDASANVIARHDFLPFGEEIPPNSAGRSSQWGPGNDNVSQKFTGQIRDEETKLDYFNARYFWCGTGPVHEPRSRERRSGSQEPPIMECLCIRPGQSAAEYGHDGDVVR